MGAKLTILGRKPRIDEPWQNQVNWSLDSTQLIVRVRLGRGGYFSSPLSEFNNHAFGIGLRSKDTAELLVFKTRISKELRRLTAAGWWVALGRKKKLTEALRAKLYIVAANLAVRARSGVPSE